MLGELGAKAREALAQIEDGKYERKSMRMYAPILTPDFSWEFVSEKTWRCKYEHNYSVISRYGIAFCGKECLFRLADSVSLPAD